MFVANFLDGPETGHCAVNVQINFFEYLLGKLNRNLLIKNLSKKFSTDFFGSYYYVGVQYVCKWNERKA